MSEKIVEMRLQLADISPSFEYRGGNAPKWGNIFQHFST